MALSTKGLPLIALILAPLALSACASPETRLRNGLQNAGLSEPMAACMAERMADRLSLMQLRRIGDLPKAAEAKSTERFMHRIRALNDPEILRVSISSAAICGISTVR